MLLRVQILASSRSLAGRIGRLVGDEDLVEARVGRRGRDPWPALRRGAFDLLVISRSLLTEAPGDLVRSIRDLPEDPEVLVLAGRDDARDRALLQAAGAVAVLSTRLADDVLGEALAAVLGRRREAGAAAMDGLDDDRPGLGHFVSASPTMQSFLKTVRRVTASDTTLLLSGETGVGKEWLARGIHAESPRAGGPFVAVHCGALPETLLESELFGHEEGAFTGASRMRRGWFEMAHGGVIFLDEIGEMPLHLQVKLLRVLQGREVQRLGGEGAIAVDVRVMAATHRDLAVEVEEGTFRRDLFYRLSVVDLRVPALRDRPEDIPELVESHIEHYRSQFASAATSVDREALEALVAYDWPGNVRELMNVIERSMLLCEAAAIGLDDLPAEIRAAGPARPAGRVGGAPSPAAEATAVRTDLPLAEARRRLVEGFEARYLDALLRQTGGRVGRAADRAGIDPRSLYAKMRRLGLAKEDYRGSSRI